MKILLSGLLLLALFQHASGQVTGQFTRAGGVPVPLVNVLLLNSRDSSLAGASVTDEKGAFRITNVAPGNYILRASCIGYQSWTAPGFGLTAEQAGKDFGSLVLHEQAGQLEAAVIRAEKPPYRQGTEGAVINVAGNVLTKGSSVLEVLERSPGVLIDHRNNSISLNGKSGVMVMLDGKLMRMPIDQVVTLLSSMPANELEKIELLTTPSSKYDAEGSAGLINIVTKKTKRPGTNGNLSVTAGYGWGEKGAGSLTINHNTGKTDLYGSYTFSHDRSYNYLFGQGSETVPVFGGLTSFYFLGISKPVQDNHNVTAGLNAKLTRSITIGGNISYNNSKGSGNSLNRSTYTLLPDSVLQFRGNVTGISH